MRTTRSILLAAAVAASLAVDGSSAGAQRAPGADPRGAVLVTSAWLAAHLADPNLVLLHVGDQREYGAQHIPGARFVSLNDIALSDHSGAGLVLEMPPPDSLRARLQRLGISDDSRVVVYWGKDWVSPATRVLFTLDHAGLGARASLLDGGMPAWARDGHPTTDVVPPARTGTLSALRVKPLVVDAAWVKANIGRPGVAIVDARTGEFYDGLRPGGGNGTGRSGHIASARSIPFNSVTDERLLLRPSAELAEIFARAGVKPGDTVVGYCHIGQQATTTLLAARALGYPVLLYDGSFTEWSRLGDGYPVALPAAKGKP